MHLESADATFFQMKSYILFIQKFNEKDIKLLLSELFFSYFFSGNFTGNLKMSI